jgi:hypothetical protein
MIKPDIAYREKTRLLLKIMAEMKKCLLFLLFLLIIHKRNLFLLQYLPLVILSVTTWPDA